jgi:hypothetical protein
VNYWKDIYEEDHEIYLFEVDEEYWSWRQITVNEETKEIIVSNKKQLGYPLTDQPLPPQPGLTQISQKEFEEYWRKGNMDLIEKWDEIKSKFPLGLPVKCTAEIRLPHGVLGSNPDSPTFVMKHELFEKKYSYLNFVGSEISGKVTGYDELNFWVMLSPE